MLFYVMNFFLILIIGIYKISLAYQLWNLNK